MNRTQAKLMEWPAAFYPAGKWSKTYSFERVAGLSSGFMKEDYFQAAPSPTYCILRLWRP
jgi:hypothetical protein